MGNHNYTEINELSNLWHGILKKSNIRQIEDQFPRFKGLTTAEIGIISIVSKKPDVILREICEELAIPKSTLTSAIDRLEKKNYIKRIISNRDRRSYGLELTEEGKFAQKEHIDFETILYGRLLDALDSEDERKDMFRLLRKIYCNLDK